MHIRDVHLQARDLAAQRSFYTAILGLPILEERTDAFAIQAGSSRLSFEATRDNSLYHIAFTIPRNKLAAAKDWLGARTPLLSREGRDVFDFASWAAHSLYFRDPGGNILEFIVRDTLANEVPGAFSPGDIICVSEIGFPVDDVPMRAAALMSALGIDHYKEHDDAFSPLGDEHGLCIVVRVGRPWFPTDTPSVVAPLACTLTGSPERAYRMPDHPYEIVVVNERTE